MTNLDMKAVSDSQWSTVNTDGFDSWNSQDIVLKNWVVTCGDVSLLPSILPQHMHKSNHLFPGLYLRQRKQHKRLRQERHMLRLRRHGHRILGQSTQHP